MNRKQMTATFHVDDMKLSHKDPDEARKLIKQLEATHAKTDNNDSNCWQNARMPWDVN